MIIEKEKVGVSWIISGTHQGEFMDLPARGRKISMEGITIHLIANGKILDRTPDGTLWACCDNSVTFLPLDSGRLSVLTKKERRAAILVTAVPSVSLSLLSS